MNLPNLSNDIDSSVYDLLSDHNVVSGSSILYTDSYDIVLIRSPDDLVGSFSIISTMSLCVMLLFALFYYRFLLLIKHITNNLLGRSGIYDR